MENYVITQEIDGNTTVLATDYKNAIFVGGSELSEYKAYNSDNIEFNILTMIANIYEKKPELAPSYNLEKENGETN